MESEISSSVEGSYHFLPLLVLFLLRTFLHSSSLGMVMQTCIAICFNIKCLLIANKVLNHCNVSAKWHRVRIIIVQRSLQIFLPNNQCFMKLLFVLVNLRKILMWDLCHCYVLT